MKKIKRIIKDSKILALTLSILRVKGEMSKIKKNRMMPQRPWRTKNNPWVMSCWTEWKRIWFDRKTSFHWDRRRKFDLGSIRQTILPIDSMPMQEWNLSLNGKLICWIREESIGFDTFRLSKPAGSNAYAGNGNFDLKNEIDFRWNLRNEIDLGFGTQANFKLPAGFECLYRYGQSKPKISLYHHGKDNKNFVVEFNSTSQGSKIRLTDEKCAEPFIGRNIQETD